MIGWALLLLVLAVVLFFISGRTQRAAGLPGGKVIYADTDRWQAVAKPLYDPVTQLTGKPDYLVKQGKEIIPVEVKSGRTPEDPYDSHIFQLAAYCLLVQREYGVRPSHGIIHYKKRTFAVSYTKALENALIDLLTEIRQCDRRKNIDRSHDQPARCRGCGFAYTCEQALR